VASRQVRYLETDDTIGIVRRVFVDYFPPYKGLFILALILMIIVSLTTAASAWIMRDVVNEIFVAQNKAMVLPIALFIVFIYFIKGLASYGQSVLLNKAGTSITADIQKRIVDKILSNDLEFHDRYTIGQLSSRMVNNAGAARDIIDTVATTATRDTFSVIALVGVMIAQDPTLSLITLVIGPPLVFGVALLVRKVKKIARQSFNLLGELVQSANEMLRGIRVVKSFTLEDQVRQELYKGIDLVKRRANKINRIKAISSPLMEGLGGISIGLIIMVGGYSVVERGNDPGSFFAFITAFMMAYDPLKRLAQFNIKLQSKLVGVQMLYEILDEPNSAIEISEAEDFEVTQGGIVLDDVTFSYDDVVTIDGMSLVAEPGKTLALVGPSGGGKSTIFTLINRFYDVDDGSIRVDGRDIRDMSSSSLRRAISMVNQDTFLFSGTIRENILMGKPESTEEELVRAANAANVTEFVELLENGFDTELGEGGTRLSGGQRQRVAIARAILKDAPILLLDEATSALDTESEAKVQEAIDRLRKGRTAIIIAHRLSTVRNADQIAVIKDGQVVENGTHDELLAHSGVFRTLHDLQFADSDVNTDREAV
jgi:ATP-binding cassette, subfamily B, bacterial MsbA